MSKIAKAEIATLVTFLIASAIVATLPSAYASPHTDVSVATAWNMITKGSYPNLFILDVRNQSEYDSGYLPKATLIPLWQLQQRIGELTPYKNTDILIYCRSGARSHNASLILDANGFAKVYDMTGGITTWNSSGYPITTPATGYTETAGLLNGAPFAVRFPTTWNGMLIIYCRGGSFSTIIPDEVNDIRTLYTSWAPISLNKGFAFAGSAYGAAGYCIRRAMNDTYDLTKYLVDTFHITGKVFLFGGSIGGGVALLLGEKYPNVYSGVLDLFGVKDMKIHYETKVGWANLSDADLTAEYNALNAPVPSNLTSVRNTLNSTAAMMEVECGGTPANASKAYEDISPTYHANIQIPVITVHGTSDATALFCQATMYQDAVAKAGRSNLYRLYPVVGGQHGDSLTNAEFSRRLAELVLMSSDSRLVSLDVTARSSAAVLPGWTWWFFTQNLGGNAPYTYQWYEGLNPIQGQTSMVLQVSKSTSGDYHFFCRVTDKDGTTTTSNAVTLTVM